jgi:hypothetical protein
VQIVPLLDDVPVKVAKKAYETDPQDAAALAALGRSASSYANAEASRSEVNVHQGQQQTPKKYIVKLEGRNLFFEYEGEPRRFGFATTRHVEAANPKAAEKFAIQKVREDDQLNASLPNDPSNPPHITMTHYVEVDSFDLARSPELGYIFYEDHDPR